MIMMAFMVRVRVIGRLIMIMMPFLCGKRVHLTLTLIRIGQANPKPKELRFEVASVWGSSAFGTPNRDARDAIVDKATLESHKSVGVESSGMCTQLEYHSRYDIRKTQCQDWNVKMWR